MIQTLFVPFDHELGRPSANQDTHNLLIETEEQQQPDTKRKRKDVERIYNDIVNFSIL